MSWLDDILNVLRASSTNPTTGGSATPQIPGAGPAPDLTGSGPILGPSTQANQDATTAAMQTNPLLSALGKADLGKFAHQPQPFQPGHTAGLSVLPQFPDVQEQPSLQGLLAAIAARRQRLAQLGLGG